MSYEIALNKAWEDVGTYPKDKKYAVSFLGDNYDVDLDKKEVFSLSCNVPAKTYVAILVLHYLKKTIESTLDTQGEWISFKELPGGEGYYPSFKKRVINKILQKYAKNPEALLDINERFKTKTDDTADASIVLYVFEKVPVMITLWKGDDEFGPEANVLFDKSIKDIFCTEDIVVMSEFVAHSI